MAIMKKIKFNTFFFIIVLFLSFQFFPSMASLESISPELFGRISVAISHSMENCYEEEDLSALKEGVEKGNNDCQLYYGEYLLHHELDERGAVKLILKSSRAGNSDAWALLQSVLGEDFEKKSEDNIEKEFCLAWPKIYEEDLTITNPPPETALNIAGGFIQRAHSLGEDNDVTPLKLQKMIFFAQACSLQYRNGPLIPDRIDAATYGPFIYDVWKEYEDYGKDVIKLPKHDLQNPPIFSVETQRLLDATWSVCRERSAWSLSRVTHQTGTAWNKTMEERGEKGEIYQLDILKDKSSIIQEIITLLGKMEETPLLEEESDTQNLIPMSKRVRKDGELDE